MILEFALCALAGICAKFADEASEGLLRLPPALQKLSSPLGTLAAILYGGLLGWLSIATPLSSLFLALALAAVLSGKIDRPLHLLGLGIFAALLALHLPPSFDPWFFSLFLLAGLLDELSLRLGALLSTLNEQRLWTPLAALLLFAARYLWSSSLDILFLAAIVCFDIGYRVMEEWGRRQTTVAVRAAAKRSKPKRRR